MSRLASSPGTILERARREHFLLVGIVLVAFVLRAYALGAESLWYDEVYTARVVLDRGIGNILLVHPFQDVHPPLYYAMLWIWTRVTGVSAVSMRALSLLASVATVPFVYAIARRLYDRRAGVLAALLFSLSPFYVYYAQEARMYAVMTFLTVWATYAMLGWLDGAPEWWRSKWGYALATVALVYTHAFGILLPVAQIAYVIVFFDREDAETGWFDSWWYTQAGVGVVAAPYYLILLSDLFGAGQLVTSVEWIPAVTPGSFWEILGSHVGRTVPGISPFGRDGLFTLAGVDLQVLGELVTLAALALLVYLAVRHVRAGNDQTVAVERANPHRAHLNPDAFLACWLIVPVAAITAASVLVTPLLFDRFTGPAGVALLILLARAITLLVDTDRATILAAGMIVLVLAVPLAGLHTEPHKHEWDRAVDVIEDNAESGDLVAVTPFWADDAYQYYSTREGLSHATLPAGATVQQVSTTVGAADTVWLVVTHQNDSQRASVRQSMERAGFTTTRHEAFERIDVYRYKSSATASES